MSRWYCPGVNASVVIWAQESRISQHFFISPASERMCSGFVAHVSCQVVGKTGRAPPVAPLQPLPVEHEPFTYVMGVAVAQQVEQVDW